MSQSSGKSWKPAARTLLIGVALVAVWQVFALALVPRLISSAYREESFGFLNGLFQGRSVHPVTHYLDFWHRFASQLTLIFSGVVLLATAILSPILQNFVDRIAPMTKLPAGAGLAAISGRRKLAVLLIVVAFPAIQAMEAVAHAEHWPFSFYSMYSSDQGSTMSWMRVYGVTESGDEIFLQPNEYLQPFDIARFPYAFEDVVLMRSNADQSTRAALANVLELYENNRRSGRHAGPPLKGLRLYRVEWHIEPTAGNKNTPDKRVFINAYPNGL